MKKEAENNCVLREKQEDRRSGASKAPGKLNIVVSILSELSRGGVRALSCQASLACSRLTLSTSADPEHENWTTGLFALFVTSGVTSKWYMIFTIIILIIVVYSSKL